MILVNMTLKISISGVRGYVPESLTPEICLDLAKAFGTYLRGGKVVIGTDPRASSEFIKFSPACSPPAALSSISGSARRRPSASWSASWGRPAAS
jgi:hypothetical protein